MAATGAVLPFQSAGVGPGSDVGDSGMLLGALGLDSSPPHPSFLFGRNGRALDAAGGLENLLYFDANPSKVSWIYLMTWR